MAYIYEDEDENDLEEENMEDIDLDDNLNGIQTPKLKKNVVNENSNSVKNKASEIINQDVPIDEKDRDFIMNNLLMAEDEDKKSKVVKEEKKITTDELLDSDNKFELTTDNLITTKDEKYFKAYIGNNYYKLTHKKFNFAALFLGPVYLLYRKVYLVGIVWLMINSFISTVGPIANVNSIIILICLLLSNIACGCFANSIYLNDVATKIVNFKIYDNNHVKEQALDKGGVNVWVAVILICVYLFIGGVYGTIIGIKYYDEYVKNQSKNTSTKKYDYFDGAFEKDDTVVMEDIITFNGVDNYFKSDAMGSSSIYYVYENVNSNLPKSTLELSVILNHDDPKLFIEAVANYELELVENVKEYNYNGLTWYSINTTNANKNIIYASTVKDGKVILLKFMYNYDIQDTVLPYYEVILANIQ